MIYYSSTKKTYVMKAVNSFYAKYRLKVVAALLNFKKARPII